MFDKVLKLKKNASQGSIIDEVAEKVSASRARAALESTQAALGHARAVGAAAFKWTKGGI